MTDLLVATLLVLLRSQEPALFARPLLLDDPLAPTGQRVDPFLIGTWTCSGMARITLARSGEARYLFSMAPLDPEQEHGPLRARPAHSSALGTATFLNVALLGEGDKTKYALLRFGRRGAKQLLLRFVAADTGLPERNPELAKQLEQRADDQDLYLSPLVCEKR